MAARVLHDQIQVAHYQLTGGNYLCMKGIPVYIADWSTGQILWPKNEYLARALDASKIPTILAKLIFRIDPTLDKKKIYKELAVRSLGAYLQKNITLPIRDFDNPDFWLLLFYNGIKEIKPPTVSEARAKVLQEKMKDTEADIIRILKA